MIRVLTISFFALVMNLSPLLAQSSSEDTVIIRLVDEMLMEHTVSPDSSTIMGSWSTEAGFFSSNLDFRPNGKFKQREFTCFGRYGYKGKWYLRDGQLSLNNGHKERKQLVYAFEEEYLLVYNDEETMKAFKEMALYVFRDKPVSEQGLFGLLLSFGLTKN